MTQYTYTIPGVHAAIFGNHLQPTSYVPCSFRRNNVHLRKLPRIFVYDGYRKLRVSFRVSFADTDNDAISAPLIFSRKIYNSAGGALAGASALSPDRRRFFSSGNRDVDTGYDIGCKCIIEREITFARYRLQAK